MHNMIKVCPVLAALVRSRALRKIEDREKRACSISYALGGFTLQPARQRIKRVLTARLEEESQKTTDHYQITDSKVSTIYANQSQTFEISENQDYGSNIRDPEVVAMIQDSRFDYQITDKLILPNVDFLRR